MIKKLGYTYFKATEQKIYSLSLAHVPIETALDESYRDLYFQVIN